MVWWSEAPGSPPKDSPDLALLMSLVTGVGGIAAYSMRSSVPGAVAGLGVAALFAWGGMAMMGPQGAPEERGSHESAHQMCLIGSLMFTGAMAYRAGSNLHSGPGGAMLATVGAVSTVYHLDKMLEWRKFEEARLAEAERLLREHYGARPVDAAAAAPPALPAAAAVEHTRPPPRP